MTRRRRLIGLLRRNAGRTAAERQLFEQKATELWLAELSELFEHEDATAPPGRPSTAPRRSPTQATGQPTQRPQTAAHVRWGVSTPGVFVVAGTGSPPTTAPRSRHQQPGVNTGHDAIVDRLTAMSLDQLVIELAAEARQHRFEARDRDERHTSGGGSL